MNRTKNGQLTGSVLKALDVLECLQKHGKPMSPPEIAAKLGLSRPTAYRLLATMENRNWVSRAPTEPNKYLVGYRILQLAGALLHNLDLRMIARPFMEQLSRTYDESVRLFILDGSEVVHIDGVLSSKPLQSIMPLGQRGCLHSKAVGKAMLAYLPQNQVERIAHDCGLAAQTPRTITNLNELKKELERVCEMGYGVADQEDVENLRAVGAAILDFQGIPVAGLAISALASQMDDARMAVLGQAIHETAAQISEQLGSTHSEPKNRLQPSK